ncbi:MAG: carboxypeptidase-like regulatory domain-containing protein [Candidatus Pacebacteria bacterium]|nr:carboxypeptidase-like regulatory domain-containing protein [Candidatus Paceibacterota bacterium]
MKNFEKRFLYISISLLILAFIVCTIVCSILAKSNKKNNAIPVNHVACTMEAKLCPDGSYVGRMGLNCDFAVCPEAAPANNNNGTKNILPYKSGVKGKVVLGPTCPVEHIPPDPNCADKPFKTNIVVFQASDLAHSFATTTSDTKGIFSVSLPPGDYTLVAGEGTLPRCDHPQITVSANTFTTTTISCDTGIR